MNSFQKLNNLFYLFACLCLPWHVYEAMCLQMAQFSQHTFLSHYKNLVYSMMVDSISFALCNIYIFNLCSVF